VIRRNICVGGRFQESQWNSPPDGMIDVADNLVDKSPGFLNAAKSDFRLRPDSPALALGFAPIPIEKIGLQRGR
jgi:hypothetical protein